MRVGIFETSHFEVTYASIRLFDDGVNKLTIFTYPASYRQLQYLLQDDIEKYEWIIKTEAESRHHFIHTIRKECIAKKIELLLLNTVADNFIFYAWLVRTLPGVRVILTLHDINNFFNFNPAFSLRRIVRFIGRRQLLKAVQEFNVISLAMVDYLKKRLPPHKQVHSLPGGIFEHRNNQVPLDGVLRIVVPGTVDERRRNYQLVFDLIKACGPSVHFTLLGGYHPTYGWHIIEQCKAYDNLHFYETEVVDQPEFDRVLRDAHVIFSPSVGTTVIMDGVSETYGVSISSGNLFDAVRFAKPLIIPASLTVPEDLELQCLRYSSVQDIQQLLERLLHDRSYYETVAQQALQSSLSYTVHKGRARNAALFARDETLGPGH